MIYLDNAATTCCDKKVCEAMFPYMISKYGNPSSIYELGNESRRAIERARSDIAGTINAKTDDILFTSGGTESDNWALISACLEDKKGLEGHIIVSAIEHHAILETCAYLNRFGVDVTYVGVDEYGIVRPSAVKNAIRKDTKLISIMTANNEIGTIQPLGEIARIANGLRIPFHSDGVAAYTQIPFDVNRIGLDYLSVSAHKICGPKGVGFLYARDRRINSYHHGGEQEGGLRAGTENVSGIVGMGTAAKLAMDSMNKRTTKELKMREYMTERILYEIPFSRLNGHKRNRLPGNMNFSFQYVDGGTLIIMLDSQGICASAGSACASNSGKPSHVLKAIGLPDDIANASVRFTINDTLTYEEANYVIDCLKKDVEKLRKLRD